MVFGSPPYQVFGRKTSMVRGMIGVFGDIPPKWQPKWEQMRAESAAKGSSVDIEWVPSTKYRLEKQFQEEIHDPELKNLLPVIQGLTKILPEDRMSASQALQLLRRTCFSR